MPKRKLAEASDEVKDETPEQISATETDDPDSCEAATAPHQSPADLPEDHAHIPSTSNAVCTLINNHDNENQRLPAKVISKKSVRFSDVTVYLFPRTQGFTCVPSSGGTTLGMTQEHSEIQKFTLQDHEQECRTNRQQFILRQRQETMVEEEEEEEAGDDEENDEEEDDNHEEEEEEEDEEEEELEDLEDAYNFPIAIPIRQRRNLLKEAGCLIDNAEKDDCQTIRTSREACGCQCQSVCNPDECSCSLNKIKCQVDRFSYPCGCTKAGCHNEAGRVEFNPVRVKTHYLNTISRLTTSSQETLTENHVVQRQQQQQSYLCYDNSALPANNHHIEMYSHHESYAQAPQCDYAYTSLSSNNSYQMQAVNVSVSMSVESYSTVCQPGYDYYPMHPPYTIDNSSALLISSASHPDVPCSTPDSYLCMDQSGCYYNNAAPSMISPVLEYHPEVSAVDCPLYSAHPSVSYTHLTSEPINHVGSYDSSPSDGSADSSGSEQSADRALDFGELIKQSLVETAIA